MTLADKKRQLKELGRAAMTPEEERAFQLDLTDTAARDLREAGRGSVKTTMKGTKVVDGKYKGLSKPEMEQAIITGAPVPTGKSGYVRGGPLTGGPGLPQRAPSAAPPMFSGLTVPALPTGKKLTAQAQVAHDSAGKSAGAAATGIARAYTDNRDMGITARDANGVQFESGARIMPGANGSKTLVSPYGSGSVQFLPAGQKPSDPVLAAATAYAKQRQAAGQFGQFGTPASVLNAARSPAPTPATSLPPSAIAGPPRPPIGTAAPQVKDTLTPLFAQSNALAGKLKAGMAPPPMTAAPSNMTPEGRMAIINAGFSSLKPPTAPGPLTQVGGGSDPGSFKAAQTRLDQRAADGAIVGMTTDGMKLATGAVNTGVTAIAGAASAIGGLKEPAVKVGSALSKTLFGDPAARARLQTPPRPSAMPPARPANTLQPSQLVGR